MRHPPATINQPPTCTTTPRFATAALARAGLFGTVGAAHLTVTACRCGGWHHTRDTSH